MELLLLGAGSAGKRVDDGAADGALELGNKY